MQPTIAGTIVNPEIVRSGPAMTIRGTDRDTMQPTKIADFRRIYRGPLDGGTGGFFFYADHKDGRTFRLE